MIFYTMWYYEPVYYIVWSIFYAMYISTTFKTNWTMNVLTQISNSTCSCNIDFRHKICASDWWQICAIERRIDPHFADCHKLESRKHYNQAEHFNQRRSLASTNIRQRERERAMVHNAWQVFYSQFSSLISISISFSCLNSNHTIWIIIKLYHSPATDCILMCNQTYFAMMIAHVIFSRQTNDSIHL